MNSKEREVIFVPTVYEDALMRDISAKHFSPVYIIYGDDPYLKKHYQDALAKKASDGDQFFNLQKFEGNTDLQEVFDAVNQFPMMAERKSVVLSDFDFEKCSKDDFERLLQLIKSANDSCVLIICFIAIDFDAKKGNKEKRLINAVNKVNGKCAEINHRSVTALVKMLSDGAKKRGCVLGEIAARYLIEVSGNDLNTLKNELDKLCAFVSEGEITKETVDLVSSKSVEASVYEYVKQIFAGNISKALKILNDMFFMHIEPMSILYIVSSSYVDIHHVTAAKNASVTKAQTVQDFAYPQNREFLLDRAAQNSKKLDSKKLRLSLEALTKADKALKTFANDPHAVLEQLTVKLVYILAKGEAVD